MRMIFRDHFLSDLIGFVYSRMGAADAAGHFLAAFAKTAAASWPGPRRAGAHHSRRRKRLGIVRSATAVRSSASCTAASPNDPAAGGRHRLRSAWRNSKPQPLDHIFPGSWINANFDVWIGAEEDNQRLGVPARARQALRRARETPSPKTARKLAFEELLIAEGSDWCWWYGPEHDSDNRPEFDQLYRDHLANVYRALGAEPPENLSQPILEAPDQANPHEPPPNPLHVTLDGEVTSAFEWMGAGRYRPDPRSGAMHADESPSARNLLRLR